MGRVEDQYKKKNYQVYDPFIGGDLSISREGTKKVNEYTKSQLIKGVKAIGEKFTARRQTRQNLNSMAETDTREYFRKKEGTPTLQEVKNKFNSNLRKYKNQVPRKYR